MQYPSENFSSSVIIDAILVLFKDFIWHENHQIAHELLIFVQEIVCLHVQTMTIFCMYT